MQRRLTSLLAALALAVAIPASALASPGTTVFAGTWISTDYDGSTQLLLVSAGTQPSVTFEDFYASSCTAHGSPATHWVSAGQGEIDGDMLFVDFHKSGCGPFSIGGYSGAWTYDAGTDTLIDDADITWHRLT